MGGDGKPVEEDVPSGSAFGQRRDIAHGGPPDGQHKDRDAQGHSAASWAILSGDEFGVALSQNVPVASATRINTAEIQ
jgi:hypothetical protein